MLWSFSKTTIKLLKTIVRNAEEQRSFWNHFTRSSYVLPLSKTKIQYKAKHSLTLHVVLYQAMFELFQSTINNCLNCRSKPGIASIQVQRVLRLCDRYYTNNASLRNKFTTWAYPSCGAIKTEMLANYWTRYALKVTMQSFFAVFSQFRTGYYAEMSKNVLEKNAFITQKMYGKFAVLFCVIYPGNTFAIKGRRADAFYMPPPDNRTPRALFLNSVASQQPFINLEDWVLPWSSSWSPLQKQHCNGARFTRIKKTLNHKCFLEGLATSYSERTQAKKPAFIRPI